MREVKVMDETLLHLHRIYLLQNLSKILSGICKPDLQLIQVGVNGHRKICITLRYQIQTGIIAGEIDKRNLFYPQPVTNTIHITDQLVLQAEILSLQVNSFWNGIPMSPIHVASLLMESIV